MMSNLNTGLKETHDDVWEVLPWYVNGTLDDKERNKVKAHLLDCIQCQDELEACQSMVAAVHRAREDCWTGSPNQLQSLFNQIDSIEANQNAPLQQLSRGLSYRAKPLVAWLTDQLKRPRWNLAVPAMLLCLLSTTLVVHNVSTRDSHYKTLTKSQAPVSISEHQLQVIFSQETTVERIAQLLLTMNARIIDGPTSIGQFTIALSTTDNHKANIQEALSAAAKLRNDSAVKFAQLLQ